MENDPNSSRTLLSLTAGAGTPAVSSLVVPSIIADSGHRAITRFAEFFTVNIRNQHTRRAYFRNAFAFLRWCEDQGIRELRAISPMKVAAYIERLQQSHAKPSVKQALAAIRMLGDWMVTGQIISTNPAHAVRGPKHVVTRGKTPVLTDDQTRDLLESIPTIRETRSDKRGSKKRVPDIIGLRDRALIASMFFTFARVGAVVAMTVDDYYVQGDCFWLRLHEKNGVDHGMPAHPALQKHLDAYIRAAGIRADRKGPLFRAAFRHGRALTRNAMLPADVWRMIRRRAVVAGIETKIGCHSFRATGITNYLGHGGTLEKAQQMASHSSPRTTKLYDRTTNHLTIDEIKKISIDRAGSDRR
jgi:site-specific recombinase XerD